MQKIKSRYILVVLVLSLFAIIPPNVIFSIGRNTSGKDICETLPVDFGNWRGERLPVEERVYRILETDRVVVNKYSNGKNHVNLSIVYYPEIRVEFHRPESCNAGRGDTVNELGTREIAIIDSGKRIPLRVNIFSVKRLNGTSYLYYYIFNSGDYFGNSYLQIRLKMAKDYLLSRNVAGSMIVFSTPFIGEIAESERVLTKFISDIFPYLHPPA